MYSFLYISWLQLAAEYGGCRQRILTSPLTRYEFWGMSKETERITTSKKEGSRVFAHLHHSLFALEPYPLTAGSQ